MGLITVTIIDDECVLYKRLAWAQNGWSVLRSEREKDDGLLLA